jgi:bifunctional DNA-binding transcriptional regulator/antitoxin component of YhaV-PrlF toxin-antitoxin module
MNKMRAKVSPAGRFSIPAKIRRAMGLHGRGAVTMEMDGNDLLVRAIREGDDEAQVLAVHPGENSSVV